MTYFRKSLLFLFVIAPLLCIQCSGTNATGTAGRKVSIKSRIPLDSLRSLQAKVSGTAVALDNAGPTSLPLNSSNAPLVQFALATNQPEVVLKSIRFDQTGTLKSTDITAIKLWLDNGNEAFNPTTDVLLASSQVKGDACEFKLEHPVSSQVQSFFITVDLNASAPGTISFLFNEESFNTTDIIGVTMPTGRQAGQYTFSSTPVEVSIATATALPTETNVATPHLTSPTRGEEVSPASKRAGQYSGNILSELEKGKTIRMQENEFLAQKFYDAGFKLFKEFNYSQSREQIAKALELNPQHKAAQVLASELQLIMGSRTDEIKVIKEFLQDQLSVKIQETEVMVRNHFLQGEKLTAERKYSEAESKFEQVINTLKWLPYDIGLNDYLVKSQERLKALQDLITQQEKETDHQMRDAASQLTQEEADKRQQEYNEKIKTLFQQALIFFGERRFEEVERIADTILKLAPHFKEAKELKKEAIRARHYEVSEKYAKLRSERLKAMYDDFKDTVIAYADDQLVRYDPEVWKTASQRKPPGVITSKAEEDPDIVEIKRKLKTIRHDFKLEGNDTLYDVTDYIQQQYKILITYAADVRQEGLPNEKKILSLTGLPLEIGLRNLLEQYGLAYGFDMNVKSLKITKSTALETELEWRVHNVDDLVRDIPEFPGPNVELPLTPGGAPGWAMPPVDLPPVAKVTADELVDLIKKNTGKDPKGASTWEGNIPGVNIRRIGESNKLLVVHSASVQDEITEFLKILRSFRSAMISVEATFLNTSDNLLESLGVELRNIPRVTIPNAPDIPGQPNPNAGLLLGGNRDARFRTAYTFRDQNNQVENALPQSAIGGLGLQFAVLGAPRINMLMTALEKTGRGIIVDSPRITAINGQRVNASFLKQRQYVQDGDIQAGAIAYEPVINTFSTGVVLDVKPIMSYDRKFITLHIFPTIIELVDSREYTLDRQDDMPNFPIVVIEPELRSVITIEQPWLRLQRCRTSAVVPDNGALVLGGFEVVSKQNLSASTPLMDKIPILSAFFRRKIDSEEKSKQFIIVRAKIIELDELERELR